MAATRLITMHINKGKTIAQSLGDRTDYAINPDKTLNGEYVSSYECSPEIADTEFLLAKQKYSSITGRKPQHGRDIIAYQIRQSFLPGEVTPEQANKIGYELAMRFTGGQHQFIVATHIDKTHVHNHIIFNSTTLDCTHKFNNYKDSADVVREMSDIDKLCQRGYIYPKKHIVSSDGLLYYPELAENYARVGIALYGMLSTRADTERCGISLEPVLSIKARVALVKDLFQGEAAGYGLQFVASQDPRIAVVAIGYGDGIPRSLSCGIGSVLIQGRKAPIVGRICMDQMLVDVSDIQDVKAGDVAVIIGQSGDERITACDLAAQDGTISNEILSRLGERLQREII